MQVCCRRGSYRSRWERQRRFQRISWSARSGPCLRTTGRLGARKSRPAPMDQPLLGGRIHPTGLAPTEWKGGWMWIGQPNRGRQPGIARGSAQNLHVRPPAISRAVAAYLREPRMKQDSPASRFGIQSPRRFRSRWLPVLLDLTPESLESVQLPPSRVYPRPGRPGVQRPLLRGPLTLASGLPFLLEPGGSAGEATQVVELSSPDNPTSYYFHRFQKGRVHGKGPLDPYA